MTRFIMAGLLAVLSAMPARAADSASTYEAAVAARYIDLDFRGSRGQVQEYDGKVYKNAVFGDVSVSNQGSEGLFDISVKDIGSQEESASAAVDAKGGFRASAKYQAMHHRLNFYRVGEVINGAWIPKTAIDAVSIDPGQEVVMRRSEVELMGGYVNPANSARFATVQYWGIEKRGSRYWSSAGTNIKAFNQDVNNLKHEVDVSLGTDIRESAAVAMDLIRVDFEDKAEVIYTPTTATGSSNNGGLAKRREPTQQMNAAEFKFRHDVSKNLAVTGAFTGRQRENLRTGYKFDAAVAALNAAYKATSKLSLVARLYARVYQVDENLSYFPGALNANAAPNLTVNTHQFDKNYVRGEFIANFRPIEKVHLKAAYKLENTTRRDAPTQVYSANRYFTDGYFVGPTWENTTAHSDVRHTFTVGAKAELPLGMEAEAQYKKLYANRAAFVNLANRQDDVNGTLSFMLPKDVSAYLMAGFLKERNTANNYTKYSQSKNTYRAGADWAMSNRVFVGADATYETARWYHELYLGSGATTPTAVSQYHNSASTNQRNAIAGVHGKVVCPKGFVVTGEGTYTRSTVSTPIDYRFNGAGAASPYSTVNDFTPSEIHIARGSLALEYTPEKLKNLTARVSYAISDWVDKMDNLNSGRASVAQVGGSYKF